MLALGKTLSRFCGLFAFVMLALFGAVGSASAQTNSYPDPSEIYTGLSTPFNSALTWAIGAIAVLAVIGWIRKAIRK